MAAPPKWAQDLMLDASVWWESQGNKVRSYNLVWRRRSKGRYSSGTTYLIGTRIVVTAGSDRLDAKLILLHELAHSLTVNDYKHGSEFWDVAWTLYRWAKLPMKYCKLREFTYRKEAKAGYARVLAQARTANPE